MLGCKNLARLSPPLLSRLSPPLLSRLLSHYKVAVVGSGPAGFYTTQELLKYPSAHFDVDIFEKSAAPFGLVRYGVAPDHPEVKNCISTFEDIASQPNVRLLGNVAVGYDLKIDELLQRYHVVVLAYGAGSDNRLGIPGEDAAGCFPSSKFVGWFNGVPECSSLTPDLSGENVAVIGHGNVALDCARILAAPIEHLERTDIAEHAITCLRELRRVRNVSLFGRRGLLQFQGTIKEVREFTKLPRVHLSVESDNVEEVRAMVPNIARNKKRLIELLLKQANNGQPGPGEIGVSFRFGWSPVEIKTDTSGHVSGIVLQKNLISGDMMKPTITPSAEHVEIPCSCVVTSIGSRVIKLPGIPFCDITNRIPERESRVCEFHGGPAVPGLYTSGWARRGSDGVLATTITDSANTALTIVRDLEEEGGRFVRVNNKEDVCELLEERGVKVVTFEDWRRIDEMEQVQGRERGKPREKMLDFDEIIHKIRSLF